MSHNDQPFGNHQPTSQQLRKSALQWQLAALDEQLGALKMLDREHSFGVENTAEVTYIVAELHDLLKSAELLSTEAKKLPPDQVMDRIKTFQKNVKHIKEEAARFNGSAVLRAKLRLRNALEDCHAKPEETSIADKPAAEPDKLFARANTCCYSAETSQFTAFAMQINAICDLALEWIYNAAGEACEKNTAQA
jgi:hypothetical protein